MGDWKSVLKADPTQWLLEEENPSVRYFALRDLEEDAKGATSAKSAIMSSKTVTKILAKQNKEGWWVAPERFYTAKYRGTVWQLMILAELGADGSDERIKRACEFILVNSQDPESGGFAEKSHAARKALLTEQWHTGGHTEGGLHSEVLPCLTGNLVWALIRLGFLEDPRVQKGIDWMTTYQRFDDGEEKAPRGWPYDRWEICWGKHTCHMGVVKMLKALAEIPEDKRTPAVKLAIEKGAEFMLMHHVHKQSHNLKKTSKPGWKKLGFPLMYQTDVLEVLQILLKLGYRDERMREAVELVMSKQDELGRWKLENTFNGRMITSIEQKGRASKWITLGAARVMKGWGE